MIALLAACASGLGLGPARVLEPGVVAVSGGVSVDQVSAQLAPGTPTRLPWPMAQVGVRVGVTERVELGARAWGLGLEPYFGAYGAGLDAKVAWKTGPKPVSLGLVLDAHRPGYTGIPWFVGTLQVPLYLDLPTRRSRWTLSPRVGAWVVAGGGQHPIATGSLGLGVRYAAPIGDRWALVPEWVVACAPVGFDGAHPDPTQRGLCGSQLGLTFGPRDRRDRERDPR